MSGGTREIKVGLFVFIAFVLLTVMVFSISDFYTGEPHYSLRLSFNFANGIQSGAPVRLVGVNIGEVRTVRIFRDETTQRNHAELDVLITKQAAIEEDSIAYINTLGLIGEKYVEIVPGTPGGRILSSGETLKGKDSVPTEQLMETGFKMMQQAELAIESINKIVGDPGTQESLKGTSEKLNLLLGQANDILGRIREGEGTVGGLLTKDELYHDLKDLTADLKVHPWKLLYRPKGAK